MTTIKTVVEFDGPVQQTTIASQSRQGVRYNVVLACQCEGFRFGGYCYHLEAAAKHLREKATVVRALNKRERGLGVYRDEQSQFIGED